MKDRDAEGDFMAELGAPARRALQGAGITNLAQLAAHSEKELLALHGFGPGSLPAVRRALAGEGLALRADAGDAS